jgi:alkylhydroperoxidase family enzyme
VSARDDKVSTVFENMSNINSGDKVIPLSQESRIPCSLPLADANLQTGNANWTKGLQSMSDWIWSGNLNPNPAPNHLARFLLWIPGTYEQQLNYSTTLIFDEPSFKNGIQISGMLDRITRELVISLIAQKRHCWYSMNHHAALGKLTANKHRLPDEEFIQKWANLTEFNKHQDVYSMVELAVLSFAEAFCTNPKKYTDSQYRELRAALAEDNSRRYPSEGLWLEQLKAARLARAKAMLESETPGNIERIAREAADAIQTKIPIEINERKVNGQIIELTYLCLQFVALTDVFTGLNVPDEDAFADIMVGVVPSTVIKRLNELNSLGPEGMEELVPPAVRLPINDILNGKIIVEPCVPKDSRISMAPYEKSPAIDKGITFGGVQTGVYGWSEGVHFPTNLAYCLLYHPELARYEPPYSLPLLFNEDEWRNGVNTSGFTTRRLKEILIQRIFRVLRSRYGIEHHLVNLYYVFLDEYGIDRSPRGLKKHQNKKARKKVLEKVDKLCVWLDDYDNAPPGTFTTLEKAALRWTDLILKSPHYAYKVEENLRKELDEQNQREIASGTRRLDKSGDISEADAMTRLVNSQIAELAMMIGHIDGLARCVTILRIPAEGPVQPIEGREGPTGSIVPKLDKHGQVRFTGYFNKRPGLLEILKEIGISESVLTANELLLNPMISKKVQERLTRGTKPIHIPSNVSYKTAEF